MSATSTSIEIIVNNQLPHLVIALTLLFFVVAIGVNFLKDL
jgi:hypothetical protein